MAPVRGIAALLVLQHAAALAPPVVKAADVAASGLASMARMPVGDRARIKISWRLRIRPRLASTTARTQVAAGKSTTVVEGLAAYPAFKTPPVLYEFEACPYCRFVREAVTALDLVVDVKPCGRGSRHRAEARKLGGKEQFPLLVDGDTVLYESADIIDYLAEKRGTTLAPPKGGVLASAAATAFRPGRGDSVSAGALSKPPRKLLELYSYEGNQFCRLVREVFCELDLPYRLYSAGKDSPRRDVLAKLAGSSQCPYLVDPNTGEALAESADIVAYLFRTYGDFDEEEE